MTGFRPRRGRGADRRPSQPEPSSWQRSSWGPNTSPSTAPPPPACSTSGSAKKPDAQQALDLLTTGLLALPWEYLPRKNRALYDGSACIDATPLPLSARGRAISDTVASTDPDGGWYVRTGDHNGDRAPIRKALWALDLHLIIASQPTSTGRQYIPALPIAMTASRPGADPAGAARRMLAALALFGHAPGYLAGDNLYTLANPVAFQQPAKEMGWSLVLPYPQGHTGKQGSSGGAPLVEGQWCCPAMPESLVAATEDFRAKRIDLATYRARIKKGTTSCVPKNPRTQAAHNGSCARPQAPVPQQSACSSPTPRLHA